MNRRPRFPSIPGLDRLVPDIVALAVDEVKDFLATWRPKKWPEGKIPVGSLPPPVQTISEDLTAHTSASPIDHPDGSVTPAKLSFDPATQAELDSHTSTDATTSIKGHVELATDGETAAGVVVQGNDSRLSNSRTPTGGAGGVLSGTYPNPGFAVDMATQSELDTHAALAATTSAIGHVELATDGETAASVVVQGNDSRLSNARTPTGSAGGVLSGTYPNPGFAADMATQAELDTVSGARPTGVSGTAGRVAFYDSATSLAVYANSIFRDAATGYLGIGTEAPTVPFHVVSSAIASGTSGSSQAFTTTITSTLTGTASVEAHSVTYDPPSATTGPRILAGLRAAVAVAGTLNHALTLRGMNAIAQHAGTGALSGTTTGQLGQVTNSSTGTIASANGFIGAMVQNAAGTVTVAASFRAFRPTGASGAAYGSIYAAYLEQQRPATGTVTGDSYGVYQEGTLDLNVWKGATTHDGKVTFNGGTVGLKRALAWYYDGALTVVNSYGPIRRIPVDVTIVAAYLVAKVAPVTSAADIDIKWSANGSTGWATIFSSRPTIAAGASTGSSTSLSKTTFVAGDYVRFDVIAAGGTPAQSLTCELEVTTR